MNPLKITHPRRRSRSSPGDSSGVTAIIAARNHAHAAQADIALAAVPAHTMRVLSVDEIFIIQSKEFRVPSAGGRHPEFFGLRVGDVSA